VIVVMRALTQLALKPFCDEMGISLRNSTPVLNIMPHDDITHGEISCGPQWEVADNEAIRLTTGFLDYYHVSEVMATTGLIGSEYRP